jgi:hypothetical protein
LSKRFRLGQQATFGWSFFLSKRFRLGQKQKILHLKAKFRGGKLKVTFHLTSTTFHLEVENWGKKVHLAKKL